MKHLKKWLYALALILVLSMTGFAPSAEDIQLKGSRDDVDYRSITPVRAYLDGMDVYVSFLDSPEKVTVIITDAEGLLVEEVVAFSPQTIQVPIGKEAGSYNIEIIYGDVCLYGVFEFGE